MTGLYQSIPTVPIYHIDRTFLFLRFSRLRVHFQVEVTNSRAPHHTDTTMFRDPWCSFITWPGPLEGVCARLQVEKSRGSRSKKPMDSLDHLFPFSFSMFWLCFGREMCSCVLRLYCWRLHDVMKIRGLLL